MSDTTDILRGELERHFELDDMKALSIDLLGIDPDRVGGADGKASFARALVDHCASHDTVEALADAIKLSGKKTDKKLEAVYDPRGDELKAGTEVDGHRIIKKLGEGPVGITYLAERKDGDDKKRVALKVLHRAHARNRSAVSRYLTAVRAASRLASDGIASVVGVGELDDGRPWVASEYVEGQTLSARIGRIGPMHFNEARPVVRGVLEALGILHLRGLAHGDVKTGNVFMVRKAKDDGSRGEPTGVLVDPAADRLLGVAAVCSLSGLAPEVCRGAAADARSDVYAVGALLYEVVAGRPPFVGDSAIDVVAQHLSAEPEAPSTHAPRGWVQTELDDAILKALAKDPTDRYASTDDFIDTLEDLAKAKKREALDQAAFEAAVDLLTEEPDDDERAAAVEEVCAPAGAWAEAVAALTSASEGTPDVEARKSLLFRVARIQESELEDWAGAQATYEAVLALDEEDELAKVGLEELKRKSGDPEMVVEMLLEKVDASEDRAERGQALREIAQIYEEKLESPDNAFVAWVQALSEDPREARAAREIERLAKNPDMWNEALQSLSTSMQERTEPAEQVPLLLHMGRWYADQLQRPDFALPCFGQVLQIDPSNDDAYDGTVDLYRKAQSWQDLVTVLLRRADGATNPAKARDYRAQAGEVVHTKLNDPERAASLFEEVLDDDPAHPIAASALERIYTEKQSWSGLVKLLETRASNEGGEAKVKTLARIGELYEDRLANLEKASVHYEQALAMEPRHLDSLKGLERIYARTDKFQELLEVLDKQLDVMATPRQRIALLERIGNIHEEEFVDHAKAAEAFEKIIAIEAGHEGANSALARLYRHLNRFDDLVETLDRHAKMQDDDSRKVVLLLHGAKVLMVDVGAPQRAIGFLERVLAVDSQNSEALETMARVQSSAGDLESAVASMDKLAEAEKDKDKRAELWLKSGKLLEDAGDADEAIVRYKRALDANIHNVAASAALRGIYEGRGDLHAAAELLLREIDATDGAISKAELFAELGTMWRRHLEKPTEAKDAFRKALELDPTNVRAAGGLAGMAFDQGDYEESVKYYEPLLSRTADLPEGAARAVGIRCGDAFRKLGLLDKAQRAYINAKAYAPDDREVLERVADVTFEAQLYDEAAVLYGGIVEKFRGGLMAGEKGQILYRQGESARLAGQLDEAIPLLEEAAELMPADPQPFASLRKLHEGKEDWDAALGVIKQRMPNASDDERFDLLCQQGDLLIERKGDREKGAKSYVSALELRADDRNLLTKLMGVYSATKDWSKLVEVILRIAELVDEPKQLGKYYITAASIAHEELGRLDEAADYYEQALDHDPSLAKGYTGLVRALTQKQDWDRLVDVYRAHLDRIDKTGTPEERAAIWDAMGEILQHRVDREEEAVEAYEEAQAIEPGNRRRLEQLSEIYTSDPERYFPKAVSTHLSLLQISPFRTESYQSLRRLYTDVKKADESWCLCQTLRVLKAAGPDETSFFKKHRARTPAEAQEFFSEEMWFNHIVHPHQDPLLSGIFATIVPAVIAVRSQPLHAFGVDESHRRDPESDESVMAQTLHYVGGVTQISLPPVFYRPSDPGGLSMLFTNPPALGLGKGALAGGPNQALAFVAGRQLAYFRGGHYLRHLVPTGSGLRAWLLAAIKTATPQFPVPGNMSGSVDECLQALRTHITGRNMEQLHSLVQKLLSAAPELDMKKWVAAVDLTADRVGFVLANDLEISAAVVKASPDDAAGVSQKERLKELYLYSVSLEYLQLRHKLGIAIGD